MCSFYIYDLVLIITRHIFSPIFRSLFISFDLFSIFVCIPYLLRMESNSNRPEKKPKLTTQTKNDAKEIEFVKQDAWPTETF